MSPGTADINSSQRRSTVKWAWLKVLCGVLTSEVASGSSLHWRSCASCLLTRTWNRGNRCWLFAVSYHQCYSFSYAVPWNRLLTFIAVIRSLVSCIVHPACDALRLKVAACEPVCVGSKISIQWVFAHLPCATWTIQLQRSHNKFVQPLWIGRHEKPSGFTGHTDSQCHWCEQQTKASRLICCRLIVEPCEVVITVHLIWCVIIIYINGSKFKFCRDCHEIAGLRANIAQWAVFAEVAAGTRLFCEWFAWCFWYAND